MGMIFFLFFLGIGIEFLRLCDLYFFVSVVCSSPLKKLVWGTG